MVCRGFQKVSGWFRGAVGGLAGGVLLLGAGAWVAAAGGCEREGERAGADADGVRLVVYCGRSRELVGPVFERFERRTGVELRVRYGETATLAATILEEGRRSPADVYFAQDAGALGVLARHDRLAELPGDVLERVEGRYRSPRGLWVGVSGRARVIAYNRERVGQEELPDSVLDLADARWRGRIGWAPTNGSFQSFVTVMRLTLGEEETERWLRAMLENRAQEYANNTALVRAVGDGEVDVGLTNHYYLHRFLAERGEGFGARNHYTRAGDPGSLVNVAGVGVLAREGRDGATEAAALELLRYLLSEEAQAHFAFETYEYPLVTGVSAAPGLVSLAEIDPPEIDLSDLDDLEGTLSLLRKVGALP